MPDSVNVNIHPTLDETRSPPSGQSVESQAQRTDAIKLSGQTDGLERLNVYRLAPIAEADDPSWDNSPSQGEVVVAARTTGDARIVAAAQELDFMSMNALPAEDVTTSIASAFRSEKLYTVIEIDSGRSDLKRGILEGDISANVIKPVQA